MLHIRCSKIRHMDLGQWETGFRNMTNGWIGFLRRIKGDLDMKIIRKLVCVVFALLVFGIPSGYEVSAASGISMPVNYYLLY